MKLVMCLFCGLSWDQTHASKCPSCTLAVKKELLGLERGDDNVEDRRICNACTALPYFPNHCGKCCNLKVKEEAEKRSTCCTCGYSWPTGQNGSHQCDIELLGKIEEMKKAPCLGCAMADTLLSMAVTAHRERLLTMDNKQCDQVFDKIVDYLGKKYPAKGGCPALD